MGRIRYLEGLSILRAGGRTARNLRGSKVFAKRARSASETVEGREGGSRAAGGCAVVLRSCLGATRAYARSVGAEGVGAARKSLAGC